MTEKEVAQEGETTGDKAKDDKSKSKRGKRHRQTDGPLNRVIIRNLPPTMAKEEFLNQIAPIPTFTAFNFVRPDWSLGLMASARAYITFEDPEDIFVFRDKYDGYVFVDAKGAEYPAVVEYAPFQGFTKTRSKKRDLKMDTIEEDSHFIAFMEALKNAENEIKSESKMEFSYKVKEDTEITSTPLLEYLESKKKEKIAEKKRKADEKKKKRDDERQSRKKQVAKNIPEPIKEEPRQSKDQQSKQDQQQRKDGRDKKKSVEKKEKPSQSQEKPSTSKVEPDDDGIMVRVVPSRLDRNQRKNKDEKEDSRRERRRDRDRKRRNGEGQGEKAVQEKNERPGKNERADKNERAERNERADKKDRSSSEKVGSAKAREEKGDVSKREEKRDTKPVESAPKSQKGPVSEPKESKPQESGSKREVKKYSERRKEIRARAENRRNEAEEKSVTLEQTPEQLKASALDVSAEPFVPGSKKPVESWVTKDGPPGLVDPFPKKTDKKDPDEKVDSHIESESSTMENEKSEKTKLTKEQEEQRRKERAERISNLRNKDRPSIAIYQPRRVRIVANFDTADSRDNKVKTPESDSKMEFVLPEKPAKSNRERTQKRNERRERRSDRSPAPTSDEKPEKSTRYKIKSVTTEDEREMSRQNSQTSEVTESRHESGEEAEDNKEDAETIVKAIEELVIKDVPIEKDSSPEVSKVEMVQEAKLTEVEELPSSLI